MFVTFSRTDGIPAVQVGFESIKQHRISRSFAELCKDLQLNTDTERQTDSVVASLISTGFRHILLATQPMKVRLRLVMYVTVERSLTS